MKQSNYQGYLVFITFVGCLVAGTLGYRFIEGWDWLEAFYMTVITITTVGFAEENPLSPTGKIFTVFLIFFGFGIVVFTISNITTLIFKGELINWMRRYFMNAKVELFNDHFVLCGYGRMGKVVAKHLERNNIPFVIIESNPDKAPTLSDQIHPVIVGDASSEEVLKAAAIHSAQGIITVASSDAENSFIAMTARRMKKELHIVSRCHRTSNMSKLRMAGADQVISTFELSGNRIAQAALHPTMVELVDFIENVEEAAIEMADIIVKPSSKLVGQRLADPILNSVGIIVVGIKKDEGNFEFHPNGNTIIETDDHLVVVGPREQVGKIADICNQG